MQVILIGFMGSGKTTIGQLLARTLATNHIDLDEFIMQKAQQSITEIFATKGETYFRQLEQLYLKQTLQLPGVLSTGGGTRSLPQMLPCWPAVSSDCLAFY